ncbi:MAG TPA: Glu-tRNA(Gln) amidotransferase subunit GatD [Nitrososphaeraceae archaeon]|nr:Glu-tRNA(Gln) amidotransferase subunit GatD [Nitrososphaeraceae archaeon]
MIITYLMSKDDNVGFILKNTKTGEVINIVLTDETVVTGRLMPGYEYDKKDHIVIKLNNGYNIGIKIERIKSIHLISSTNLENKTSSYKNVKYANGNNHFSNTLTDLDQPKILLLSTGGTIASKIDYRTGGVTSVLSAQDLYSSVPEISDYAKIDTEILINEYSENIGPNEWNLIINKIIEKINLGMYHGIIISHGTDTMSYTASALSFALQNIPIPVILVGAQRSSDRPSSDASSNLIGAVICASRLDYSGVFVVMHSGMSDDVLACHIGTRVRKNHTSKRDAFQSIDVSPVATIKKNQIYLNHEVVSNIILKKRSVEYEKSKVKYQIFGSKFDNRVFLLKYYPGFNPMLIEYVVSQGNKIVIIEGTGLGHINKNCISYLKKAIDLGVLVFMTSQCIWGRTNMNVYDTGRDLLKIGVIPLFNMLSETAVVKAMWLLGNETNYTSIIKIMQENISNEIIPISHIL